MELRWTARGPAHHVELLALDRDEVLLARDVVAPPLRLELPWPGTYRWRVAARDARGVESRPSAEGLICSVDRVAASFAPSGITASSASAAAAAG